MTKSIYLRKKHLGGAINQRGNDYEISFACLKIMQLIHKFRLQLSSIVISSQGNVRELIHLIERSVLLCEDPMIDNLFLPTIKKGQIQDTPPIKTMTENERDHILEVLSRCDWKIYGRGGAADLLEINASTLKSRMKKLGISKRFD